MTHATARHASLAEINITPLVDVMLVLLVIFMITAPVLAQRIDVEVNGVPPVGPKPIVQALEVQADGSVRWDGVLLPADAVPAQMQLAKRAAAPPQLRITAARGTAYTHVAPVLAEARNAGIDNLEVPLDAN
jgi:biopolymer transport protein ExbD